MSKFAIFFFETDSQEVSVLKASVNKAIVRSSSSLMCSGQTFFFETNLQNLSVVFVFFVLEGDLKNIQANQIQSSKITQPNRKFQKHCTLSKHKVQCSGAATIHSTKQLFREMCEHLLVDSMYFYYVSVLSLQNTKQNICLLITTTKVSLPSYHILHFQISKNNGSNFYKNIY